MHTKEEIKIKAEELLKTLKELIREGNVRRVIVKDDKDKVYLDIPVTVGVVGAVLAPFMAMIGTLTILAVDLKIEIIRED